jgi:drug/metabolite transporter (DMT)-like permease
MVLLGEAPSVAQLLGVGLVAGALLLATAGAPRSSQAVVAGAAEGS